MKTYCKNVDITDRNLIKYATYNCLQSKYTRKDTLKLLSYYSNENISTEQIYKMIKESGKISVSPYVENIIDGLRNEIINKNLILKPIFYKEKLDGTCLKIRRIGIQDVKQQIYDYIAVEGIKPMLKRIGEHQYASIKGRGQINGVRRIQKWLRNKNIRYAGKADIKKCFENISREKMMNFLNKYVKNDLLLWLINELLSTFESGLSIGSYLSQFLCNLYMSQLYHEISENMFRIRKHKNGTNERINLVNHVLIYMDDILILGTNSKDLNKAMKLIIKFANNIMGLDVKSSWTIFKTRLQDRKYEDNKYKGQFIDIMGFRIYRWHTTIRRRIFKRIRKSYMKALKFIKIHKEISMSLARKCISYYGYIRHTDSFKFKKHYKVYEIMRYCKRKVLDESKIRCKAASC